VEDYIMRSLMISTPKEYYSGYQIEKNEMGGACSTYGVEKNCIQILEGKPEEKRPTERTRRI
jgi:hypothetical protein